MKYLKTYESFTDPDNIVGKFSNDDVEQMYQELFDDFDIKSPVSKIFLWNKKPYIEDDSSKAKPDGALVTDREYNKYYVLLGDAYEPFSNAYFINAFIEYTEESYKKIESILNHKKEIYGVEYIICFGYNVHHETGLVSKKITGFILF